MATKSQTQGGLILLGLITLAAVTYAGGLWRLPAPLSVGGPVIPQLAGTAFCPATSTLASPTSPPTGCYNQAQILSIKLMDFYAAASLTASAYTCKIFVLGASGWQSPESVAAGAAPTTCTSGLTYLPGTQITLEVCKDTTPACVSGDYTAQKSVYYCPLPSIVGSGICSQGPGAGVVPFSTTPSASSAPTSYYSLPIVLLAGQAVASATPDLLTWTWQNGTAVTVAATCFINTGTNACDLPKATSTGRMSTQLTIGAPATGGGTAPANPMGAGYSTFTQIDPSLQSGVTARGPLQAVLQVEVKATTNSDMCLPTSGFAGITPTVIPKNSATDILYDYVIPDAQITRTADASGNVLTSGQVASSILWDCSQVFNGSGDVVTITANLYVYYSLSFVKALAGSLNPEAVTQNPTAFALSIKT